MEKFKSIPKDRIEKLPQKTGVYLFYIKSKIPIYIGKAVNIKNRVKNHFQQPNYKDELFISQINKIGFLETNSEIEALILEAQLIKKYQPKYNVMWRDDKNYFYVAIAENPQKIPYVYITHQPKLKAKPYKLKANFIGPFIDGTALKKTLRFLRRAFPHYTRSSLRSSGQAIHPKNKCTYCHLGLCPGPVPNLAEYKKNIKKLILVLSGKRSRALNYLKKEMHKLSKESRFEEAGRTRDRIYNLQQVMSHTQVIGNQYPVTRNLAGRVECYDVSNIQGKFATGSMVVFVDGRPNKSQYKKFRIRLNDKPNDIAMLKEVLERRFAHKDWPVPDAILIDGGKAQLNAALEIRSTKPEIRNIKVMSLAKGRQELFIEGKKNPIPLKMLPQESYNLIKQLDDEAHRFAIAYHRKLHLKKILL